MIPLHLGALHPVEQWLTLALAVGPFVLLGIVIWWRRRQDGTEQAEAQQPGQTGQSGRTESTDEAGERSRLR